MPTETLPTSESLAKVPSEPLPRHRYRLRFAKTGDLRLVSHHDLMHVLERLMRRGEIPFDVTKGFHPQPKMSFALSLALGVVGRNEVFDVELTRELSPEDLISRLNRHAPIGLTFLSGFRLEKKPSSQVRRTFYRIEFPVSGSPQENADGIPGDDSALLRSAANVELAIATFLSQPEHWIVRERPQRRRINLRPFVCELSGDSSHLEMVLWVTPTGAARPEEIVKALGLGSLLDEGAVLERTHLELLDEVPEHERFVPDLAAAATSAPAPETPNDAEPAAGERAKAPTATSLIANPLSFDS